MHKFKFIAFLTLIIASANVYGQTWYWTKQADSSSSQTATQVAVDRNNNPVYTGYFSGARMAFGNIGISSVCNQSDFLVKYTSSGTPVWAKCAVGLSPNLYTYGVSVATDRNNDVVEAGYFNDSIAFGTYHLSAKNAAENTFLVKYDPSGNVLWAAAPTITMNSYMNQNYGVTTDKQNNIYITGYFVDTAIFGRDTLTAAGLDMYLVKYNPVGKVIWARAPILRASGSAYGLSVAADDSGNAYVSGNLSDSAFFGNIEIGNTGNATVYLAKYDSTGKAKWAFNTTAVPNSVLPTPVVVDKSNNVYLGFQFINSTLTFGSSTITDGASPCSNAGLVKFDRNGNVFWATCADFISADEVCVIVESAVTTDRCNNVYWSGLCSDTFGVGKVKVTVPGGGSHPTIPFAYVIKLDSNSNPIAGAALRNQNGNSFSNYLACDSLSKVLFASELVAPATLIVGNDTVHRYLATSTCFLSKFAVIPSINIGKNSSDSICYGDSLVFSVVPVIGTNYTWSTGKTTDSITVKPLTNTTYYLIANDGCVPDTSFINVVVTPPIMPAIKAKPDSICKGDSVTLVGSGGTKYKWSTGKTTDSIRVSPSINTTYTLTVYSGNCSKDTTITIYIIPTPTAVVTAVPDSVCPGDSVLLAASGGVTYKWSNGKTTTSIWVNPLITTTYTVQAYAGSCSDSATIKVYTSVAITASISANDTVCPNTPVTITATGSGGTVGYKWSTGATTSSINVTDTVTTTYTATVYGKCDSVKKYVTVVIIPLPKPIISGTSMKCGGTRDTLTVSGGTTYLWSNGKTTTNYITGPINGDSTITVIAYNSLGCSDTTRFKITEKIKPAIGTIQSLLSCHGSPVTFTAVASGNGPFTYRWSNGQTTSSITVSDTGKVTYTVTVSNGCPNTTTATVSPDVPALNACCNKIIILGDDTIISASGPDIIKYQWVDSNNVICENPPVCSIVKVSPTVTTTYTVIGTDSLGCEPERVITIVVETPCFDFKVPNVFTPNYAGVLGSNGGTNNIFYIETKNITGWSTLIYDRWGKEMFKTTDPNKYWDGNTESGSKAPDGVYYYIISGTCHNNTYKKDGFLQLIR